MKHARRSLSAICLASLVVLLVSPVGAAPSLSLGSSASYQLTASIKAEASCFASNATITQWACGIVNPPITAQANVWDNGTCSSVQNCGFSPSTISLAAGSSVMWTNIGQQYHTVTSCSTANSPPGGACPIMNDASLPSFSITLYPRWIQTYMFATSGTYHYYCAIHPWLHGEVTVTPATPLPAPTPMTFQLSVAGPVSWAVIGLDGKTGVLNVTHQLGATFGGVPVPVTETGSFEESIDLATRIESPGAATSLVQELTRAFLGAIPVLGAVPGPTYITPTANSTVVPSVVPSAMGQVLLSLLQSHASEKPMYTIWWVNGPLILGSPVLILTGYGSVRGSETISLGTIGNRDAWIVGSDQSQSFSVMTPGTAASLTNINEKLSLRFDYDKTGDLLLKSNNTATVGVSVQTFYQPGQQLCNPTSYVCTTIHSPVTVTHTIDILLSVSLQLVSTNIPLSQRITPQIQGPPPTTPTTPPSGTSQASMSPLLIFGAAGVAALAIVGLGVWIALRSPLRRREAAHINPEPEPTI